MCRQPSERDAFFYRVRSCWKFWIDDKKCYMCSTGVRLDWKHFGWHWICCFYVSNFIRILCVLRVFRCILERFWPINIDLEFCFVGFIWTNFLYVHRAIRLNAVLCQNSILILCLWSLFFSRIVNHINYLLSFWLNVPICC